MTDALTIQIDEEVWDALKAEAEPFVDSPNSVLRRKLGLSADDSHLAGAEEVRSNRGSRRRRRQAPSANGRPRNARAPRGSLLPEEEYVTPILSVLHKHGGRAPTREVIEEVGALVRDRLAPLDHEELASGGYRWQKRIQFTRLRLVERGLVEKHSPRGVWEITDEGRRVLSAERARVEAES